MATTEIGGTAYLKVGASQVSLRGSLKINPGGPIGTPVMGMDGKLHGTTTKYKEATAAFEVSDAGSTDVAALRNFTGQTVTLELGNGKTYILPAAIQIEDTELDAVEGKFSLKIVSDPNLFQQILASA